MKRRYFHLLLLTLLAVFHVGMAQAEFDALQMELSRDYPQPLRWDNVEGEPHWRSGQRPQRQGLSGLHRVRLKPGQHVSVRVPAGESLRIHGVERDLTPDDLAISRSNGTGLAQFVSPIVVHDNSKDDDGKRQADLVLSLNGFDDQLLHIHRPAHFDEAIEINIFVSRHGKLPQVVPYRYLIKLPGAAVRLKRHGDAVAKSFWPLGQLVADQHKPASQEIELSGPLRLLLEQRYVYSPEETETTQRYQIETTLDGKPWHMAEFETGPERIHILKVNGESTVLGRLERSYIDVPAGIHRLRFVSRAPLYGRLLEQRDDDYLWSNANRPVLDVPEVHDLVRQQQSPEIVVQQQAWQMVQDNSQREGALLGAALMAQQAAERPDTPALAKEAQRLQAAHTFYRDLLPDEFITGAVEAARFSTATLIPWSLHGRGRVVAEQHVDALLAKGMFTQVTQQTATYSLPERLAPSTLRLVVDNTATEASAEFYVQFDNQPPLLMRLAPGYIDNKAQWLPGAGESSLRLEQQWDRQRQQPQMPGDGEETLAVRTVPDQIPVIATAVLTLPLPEQVQRVKVWRTTADDAPLRLAMQYGASAAYRLSESTYLSLIPPLFTRQFDAGLLLQRLNGSVSGLSDDHRQVHNHWQGLRRQMRVQHKQFVFGVTPPTPQQQPRYSTSAAVQQAKAAELNETWQTALQHWSVVVRQAGGELRRQAWMGQVRALENLGEAYLARQTLRGLFIYDDDPALRQLAFQRLAAEYRQRGRQSRLLGLYASAVLREPTAAKVQAYAELLLAAGQADEALLLALLLPLTDSSADLVLAAAYQAQWWQVFEQALARVSREQAALWRGYRAEADGDYVTVLAEWRQAGSEGEALARYLEQGLDIRARLSSAHLEQRQQALVDWQQWQARHPGAKQWRKAPRLVSEAAGAAALYVIERDLVMQNYRSTPQRPLKLRVLGPAAVRLDVRPVHQVGDAAPLDGWLRLRAGEQRWVLPINGNRPTEGLQWIGQETRLPGTNEVMEFAVGPGQHELELSGGELELLVSVSQRGAQIPLALLPPLMPRIAAAVLSERMAIQLGVECNDNDAPLFLCRQHSLPSVSSALSEDWTRLSGQRSTTAEPLLVNQHDLLHQAVALTPAIDEQAASPRAQMTRLLWQAEHQPEQRMQIAAAAEMLAAAHLNDEAVQRMAARLTAPLTWQLLPSVDQSAGLRQHPSPGWQPQSPQGKARKALIGIDDTTLHMIGSRSRLGLALSNQRAVSLKLVFDAVEVPFVPLETVTLSYRVDDGAARFVQLNPGDDQVDVRLDVPKGNHVLRVALIDPQPNRYVSLRLWERPASDREGVYVPLLRQSSRSYHVATAAEPVRLRLKGPGLVRIDELRDADTFHSYRALQPGWQYLELRPGADQDAAMYRIFRRIPADDSHRAGAAVSSHLRILQGVPRPALSVAGQAPKSWPKAIDELPLKRQEDGTWSFAGLLANRRQVDEDDQGRAEGEKFLELRAEHRHYNAFWPSYNQGRLLGRVREEGGPTLGALGWWEYQPRWRSWRVGAHGSLYMQSPEGGSEWAARLSAVVSQRRDVGLRSFHRPYARIFQRWLSMDDYGSYPVASVDQDIFSRYKADHLRGLTLGDRVVHRPWLDTQWYGGVALTTNEDFNPFAYDNLNLSAGWRQLMGDWQGVIEYRLRHFRADEHRSRSNTRPQLNLHIEWNHWHSSWRRWQLWFKARRDIDVATNSFWFGLTWHTGNGRGLRDFRPVDESFRELRELHLPAQPNNHLERGDGFD